MKSRKLLKKYAFVKRKEKQKKKKKRNKVVWIFVAQLAFFLITIGSSSSRIRNKARNP
jgi:hypothetical protein